MKQEQAYFPQGELGKKKAEIYLSIQSADEGGLDRKSVLLAMDHYAEAYYIHECLKAFRQGRTYFVTKEGKKIYSITPFGRRYNVIKYWVKFRWLLFKYWWKRNLSMAPKTR